jgi:hypothetical protein
MDYQRTPQHKQTARKREGGPPPNNPNQLNLIKKTQHYGRQQCSATAEATTMTAKHLPEPWRQSIRQNYDHRRGKASADGAITLSAAKLLHERGLSDIGGNHQK